MNRQELIVLLKSLWTILGILNTTSRIESKSPSPDERVKRNLNEIIDIVESIDRALCKKKVSFEKAIYEERSKITSHDEMCESIRKHGAELFLTKEYEELAEKIGMSFYPVSKKARIELAERISMLSCEVSKKED